MAGNPVHSSSCGSHGRSDGRFYCGVVYDSVGKDTFAGSIACLQRFGLLVSFGSASGYPPPFTLGDLAAQSIFVTRQTVFNFLVSREATQEMADDMFGLITSGQLKVHIAQRYPLEQVSQAHAHLEARQTLGAIVLTL